MLVRREAYLEVGGIDPAFAIAFNDVDLCIRLRQAGWRIVLAAGAELCHRESRSVGLPTSPARRDLFVAEQKLMESRWAGLTSDPFYNPNLGLAVPGELAFPPRVVHPWR